MPKTDDVEIHTMDVYKHLDDRARKAKNYRKEQTEQPKPAASSSAGTAQEIEKFDLQAELEKKFDELFGDSDDDE